MKKYWPFFVFILGFLLRFYQLSNYPHSLHRDELAVGYNAYSLLKVQRGEHGEGPWPMNFISFGDYKMPGLIYLLAPFIKIFGLNEFAIRFPNAVFGSLAVIFSYLLLTKIFPKRKKIAFWSSLFLALAPYHIHASRMVYEPQVAFVWQLLGLLILIAAKRSFLKFFSLPFFLMAMFTYNSPLFLVLPLCIITLYFFKKDFFNKKTRKSTIFFLTGLIFIYGIYFVCFKDINAQKAKTTILNREEFIEEINQNIDFIHKKGVPLKVARLFYNKPLKIVFEFGKRYFSNFNPAFLFFSGDKEPFSDLSSANIPNLYPYLLPIFLIGIFNLVINRKKKENIFIIVWFLVAAITSGFANISPNTTKLFDFHFLIIIISSIGWLCLLANLKKHSLKGILFLILILAFFTLHFTFSYFIVYPKRASKLWLPELKEVINYSKNLDYDHFFVDRERISELVYIYFAFYTPFEPEDFSQHTKRSSLGFNRVESYKKYIFGSPPPTRSLKEYNNFIDKYGKSLYLSDYKHRQEKWEDIKVFYFKGEPLWVLQKKY